MCPARRWRLMVSSGAGSVTHCPLLWTADVRGAGGGGGTLPGASAATWRGRHVMAPGAGGPTWRPRKPGEGQPGMTPGTMQPSHLVGMGRPQPRSEDAGARTGVPAQPVAVGPGPWRVTRSGLGFLIWTQFPRGLRGPTARASSPPPCPPRQDRQEGPPSPSPARCQDSPSAGRTTCQGGSSRSPPPSRPRAQG